MNVSKQSLTYLFVVIAVIMALVSLVFSNRLVKELAREERAKLEIWASATEQMAVSENDMSLVLKVLQSNNTIPVILYDENTQHATSNNLRLPAENEAVFLRKKMEEFSKKHDPILLAEVGQRLYYDDSYTLKKLQWYPYIQFAVIAIFVALAFFTLLSSHKAEQSRMLVGLAKETAHQLGTPISSLVAWTEYLRLKAIDESLLSEISKDTERLQTIALRFSKIGSVSDKNVVALQDTVRAAVDYLENRISDRVQILYLFPEDPVFLPLNEPLIHWVIENLTKNAVDAMEGQGVVTIAISESRGEVTIDVSDTGKGIPRSKFKSVFNPGFTTKERGWGLGLSLVKRIVEEYHNGKIFVKQSEIGKGTTFRIVLRKE